jgi:UPF0755 protein
VFVSLFLYQYLFKPNVILKNRSYDYLNIPTGSGFDEVKKIIKEKKILKNTVSFEWTAHQKQYESKVRPGKYRITDGMSNNALINLLRSGRQEPVKVTFQNIRNREEFAGKISRQIEADSISILYLLRDDKYMDQYGINALNSILLFIPNTYEFYWNTSAEIFFKRMARENNKFWNEDRKEKCQRTGLSRQQVAILASIVEKETSRDKEKPVIAGVYMNRLRKGWPLQADPTIIFAWNDYSIKRVLHKHIRIISPYNTYAHSGLPPGPICLPSIASIDAVLNFEHHDYMYFCAKDDLSGYHVFAETLPEHNRNAKKYQSAIKKLNL